MPVDNIKAIALVGGESTGKSTLASLLAEYYGTIWVPEFARQYLNGREGFCEKPDLDLIALGQLNSEAELSPAAIDAYFTDTDVLTTVIWYEKYFEKAPDWMLNLAIASMKDYYFLCSPDFPWIKDEIRYAEEHREWMHNRFIEYLEKLPVPYSIIKGQEIDQRLSSAIEIIGNVYPELTRQEPDQDSGAVELDG